MRFKIDWVSLIVGRKLTVFALYVRAISNYNPPGGLIFRGAIERRVFCVTSLGGLYLEGAYFRNFTVVEPSLPVTFLADSPYTDTCLNLSTKATFFCPQDGHCEEIQLY